MTMLARYSIAPTEETPYTIDYCDDLDTGDALSATSATIAGPDTAVQLVYAIYTENGTSHFAKVMLAASSAAVVGNSYTITVTTLTAAGRTMVDTFTVKIKAA
jgi:hypothetical protein